MQSPNYLEETRDGEFLTWTINRPERLNALGVTIAKEIHKKLNKLIYEIDKNQGPRALFFRAKTVKTSRNPIWIAGGDLKELASLETTEACSYSQAWCQLCESFEGLDIPIIMVVDGHAIGGGAELALFGDLRIGTLDTKFVFKQLQIGLATGYGGAKRLKELVGLAKAQHWLYWAQSIDAKELETTGVLHKVLSTDQDLESEIASIKTMLLGYDRGALRAQKTLLGRMPGLNEVLLENAWRNPIHEKALGEFIKK